MGRLRTTLREQPVNSGWGLDLSNTSLKAIQLTVGDDDQVRITQCVYVAHRLHLTHPDAAAAGKSILLESLGSFTSQCPLKPTERIATQWPGIQSLVRYVTVPPANDKKSPRHRPAGGSAPDPIPAGRGLLGYVPIPHRQDEFTEQPPAGAADSGTTSDLEARLELLSESGINVSIMQCDALALHNFACTYDPAGANGHTAATGEPLPTCAGIAALDVGSDATAIVFSFPDFVWFRAARPAGDDLTMGLARRFKITRDVAERVKRDPTKAKRMSDLYQESSVVFRKIANQFDTAQSTWKKSPPANGPSNFCLTGGGGQTHGLLRFLRFGR